MAKTIEIHIECEEARIKPNRYNQVTVVVENPNLNNILSAMDRDEVASWVFNEEFDAELVCGEKQLEKWAEENGYTKEN